MRYALLIHSSPAEFNGRSEDEQNAIYGEYMAVSQRPEVVGGEQLQPVETATTVRVQNGDAVTSDGPFAETKEALGGFFLLDADNLDSAIEIAAQIPAARFGGGVEIRPLVER